MKFFSIILLSLYASTSYGLAFNQDDAALAQRATVRGGNTTNRSGNTTVRGGNTTIRGGTTTTSRTSASPTTTTTRSANSTPLSGPSGRPSSSVGTGGSSRPSSSSAPPSRPSSSGPPSSATSSGVSTKPSSTASSILSSAPSGVSGSSSLSATSSAASSVPSSGASCSLSNKPRSVWSVGRNRRAVEQVTLTVDGKDITVSATTTDQGQTANTWRTAKFPKAGSTEQAASIIKCFKAEFDTEDAFNFEKTALQKVDQFVNSGTNACGRRCLVIVDLSSKNLLPAEDSIKKQVQANKFTNRQQCLDKLAAMGELVKSEMKSMVEKTQYLHLDNHIGNCFFNADGTQMEFIDWGRNAEGKGVKLLANNVFPENDADVTESIQLVDFSFTDEFGGLVEECPE